MSERQSWFDLYSKATTSSEFLSGGGSVEEFNTATLNLPKKITRIWSVKQLSELPSVKIQNKAIDEIFSQDILKHIEKPVSKLMGLGRIFIVPSVNEKLGLVYDVIAQDDETSNIDYFEQDGELLLLTYVKAQKILKDNKPTTVNVVHEHIMRDNVYYFTQYYEYESARVYLDGNDGSVPISNDIMLPFKIDLNVNADSVGIPIWANASNVIEDCNKTYHEMMNAMELLRPVVGIPKALTGSHARDKDNDIKSISSYNRIFAVIPGLEEVKDWAYFGGTYDPRPYIETLNAQLSEVSSQCGFGRHYLTYNENGGLKTAKEVIYSQNDMFVNQLMINQTIEKLLKRLVHRLYYLEFTTFIDELDIEVVFEDSVFNSREEYMNQLELDYSVGAITREFYLKERYPQEDISLIMAIDEPNFSELM